MSYVPATSVRQNKANFSIADCGLRIGDCGLGTDPRRNACPAAWRLWPLPGPIVRNKPNFHPYADPEIGVPRGRLCKTNPIPGGARYPPFHYSIIPAFQARAYCTKQSQFPCRGPKRRGRARSEALPPLGRILRNKANRRRVRVTTSALWGKSYGECGPCKGLEKTKPIAMASACTGR